MDLHNEKMGTLSNQLAHHFTEMNKLLRLVELDKLEFYLKGKGLPYERIDKWDDNEDDICPRHQIMVNCDEAGWPEWSAICHRGSYGYHSGLLEIAGSLVDIEEDGDSVAGYLTAQDVIDRIERKEKES